MSALAARLPSRDQVGSFLSWRRLPVLIAFGCIIFAFAYVLFIAKIPSEFGKGGWRTTNFGSAVDDRRRSLRTSSNGLTFAGVLFIVASGFSLIFGLMRVVNMAHGSFYLLGGYIAYEVQQEMTGQGFSSPGARSTPGSGSCRLLVAAPCIAVVGFVMQQSFLRWNQGQELRQALITIAVSVIVADQMIAHFPRTSRASGSAGTPST